MFDSEKKLIDWVIVGGESGPHARPMHPDWARSLRDQCEAAGVPFLFKQWGEFTAADQSNIDQATANAFVEPDGTDSTQWPIDQHGPRTAHMVRIGKKATGRLLDGRRHDEFPKGAA
jgi:protein gp37